MVERVSQIAEACIKDMQEYDSLLRKDLPARQVKLQANDFLANIYYFRICSYTEQIAVVNYLEKFISEHKEVSTVTFYFLFSFRRKVSYSSFMLLIMLLKACLSRLHFGTY